MKQENGKQTLSTEQEHTKKNTSNTQRNKETLSIETIVLAT
jgi:hypothetical protein